MRTQATFRLSAELRRKFREGLATEGYSIRKKSKWICEALANMFEQDPGLKTVGLGDALEEHNETESISINNHFTYLEEEINRATRILRRQNPFMEGVRSAIYRAAIRRRLEQMGKITSAA